MAQRCASPSKTKGPGFAPEQRARAFKPFYTTKVTGTGLGLTICRRIVECHDGRDSD